MKDANEYLFLSEYQGANKSAWVCLERLSKKYIAIGYLGGVEKIKESFDFEHLADDFAEDWVLIMTPE